MRRVRTNVPTPAKVSPRAEVARKGGETVEEEDGAFDQVGKAAADVLWKNERIGSAGARVLDARHAKRKNGD